MADVIFHTSGSTGEAKEIVRTEAALQEDARRLRAAFPEIWDVKPAVVASVRPEHMYGALWRVRVPALVGCVVDPSVTFSVEELFAARGKYGKFLFVTTPSFLEKAVAHVDFASLRGAFHDIVISGSALRSETAKAVAEAVGVWPLEIYGSTEAGTVAWRRQSAGEVCTLMPGVAGACDEEGRLVVESPYAMAPKFVMGDLVTFVSTRQFVLRGRADRQVKILERYVSLDAVERALRAHRYVGQVRIVTNGEGVPRLGALIVLSASGREAVVREGSKAVSAALRLALRAELPDIAIPRRFRFVRALPVNEQGKTTAEAVRNLLSLWCREPVVRSWQVSTDRLEAELAFDPDAECFQGHFPRFAVLPGVAQLYFLQHFAQQVFPDWPRMPTFLRLKFQKVILPRTCVKLVVLRNPKGGFDFSFDTAENRCTSGSVKCMED